jgi:NodT family efflux transporter outer membrane factor (OMF) lipoprotein
MRALTPHRIQAHVRAIAVPASFLLLTGCFMIGPDYVRPEADTAPHWIDADDAGVVRPSDPEGGTWWSVFGDPVLDRLISIAYRQNPTLHAAGARVLEALARRGIAIGTLFPQVQQGFGTYQRGEQSENRAAPAFSDGAFTDWQLGFDAAWELDVWGRLRRGIESADASVLAGVASYDDVLVSLIAEVASNYIQLRTFEEGLAVTRANVAIQERSFEIADAKYRDGAVSRLDSLQAASLLEDTRAQIPQFEANIRQASNTLCVLLGIPPRDLDDLLGGETPIPDAPATVAVGVPADLLRRRPDVRRAERNLAAQSALIGIAKADLLPIFSLTGTIELAAEDFADLFKGDSFEGFGGPSFRWAILNYGRIANNIRVQDARYQALVSDYENVVLQAQGEVENAIAAFLGSRRQVEHLTLSVDAARAAVDVADIQYREGAADYTRVLNTQQALVVAQDRIVRTRGTVSLSLTALYKALGGGWELRVHDNFVPQESRDAMAERTRWGALATADAQHADLGAASRDSDEVPGWRRWRWWWPRW